MIRMLVGSFGQLLQTVRNKWQVIGCYREKFFHSFIYKLLKPYVGKHCDGTKEVVETRHLAALAIMELTEKEMVK